MVGPSKYRKQVEKDLVAEQPGLGLALIGILIAMLMGLAIKVTIAPEKVRRHIEKALASIPEDIQRQMHIQLGEASISLSQGIWPDLSVVVKDVKISSNNVCWLSPQIDINEVRLPLSWSQLFLGHVDMREIRADEVDLSVRNAPADCPAKSSSSGTSSISAPQRGVAQALAPAADAMKRPDSLKQNPIRKIVMQKFLVHYLPVAFTTFEIDSFTINILSTQPKLLELTGKLNLGGDTLVGDYASHANLKIRYDEAQSSLWTLTARGDWREGQYDLSADYDQTQKKYESNFEFKHLPLSQIMPLLVKYRLLENEYNGRQIWLAGKVQTAGSTEQWEKNPVHITNFKIEGDLGDIQTPRIEIHSLRPLYFDPVQLDLRGFNLDHFLVFLEHPHPSPALGSLGSFNGVATVEDLENIHIRGDHSGLEFIFSNMGARETQTISLLSGEVELNQHRWKVKIDRIRPLEGIFDGVIQMQADQNWRDLEVESKVDEMSFSPNVQSLMTGGGSLGALSGRLKAHLHSGEMKALEGLLKADRILIDGMSIEKPKLTLSTQKDFYFVDVNAQAMEIDQRSPTGQFAMKVLTPPDDSEKFLLKNMSVRFQTKHLKDLRWSSFQSLLSDGTIHSQGGWDENGNLFGDISVREQKVQTHWLIRGNRDLLSLQKAAP